MVLALLKNFLPKSDWLCDYNYIMYNYILKVLYTFF